MIGQRLLRVTVRDVDPTHRGASTVDTRTVVSVVVPAHNEEAVIGRLLQKLLDSAAPNESDVVVVRNGCADGTAEIAASFGPPVRTVVAPAKGKYRALRLGDAHAAGYPRIYLDADVEIGTDDVRRLAWRVPEAADGARTWAYLLTLCRSRPLLPKLVAFLSITLLARWRARRTIRSHDYTTWLRDESSRAV